MVGRTADHGDEPGSRLLSTRLAGDLMWLAFTLSRQWAPYPKWRGTAFRSLPIAADLADPLTAAAAAPHWRDRESALQSPFCAPAGSASFGLFADRRITMVCR